MIRTPRKNVTRFFIPMIDVLILLFCIFLLMPFAEKGAATGARLTPGEVEALKRQVAFLEKKLAELEKNESNEKLLERIAELEEELKRSSIDRIELKMFRIDAKTGALSYLETPRGGQGVRVELKNEKEAEELIDRHLAELVGRNKELVYAVFYPGERSPHPTQEERAIYERWLRRVNVRWESSVKGKTP